MKFPYGIVDFRKIRRESYFYCDRTDKIPLLEEISNQLFIRPRRFGKSLLLSMLENYYDILRKDEFDQLFGELTIGTAPTPLRNSYLILRFDFSCVDASGDAQAMKKSLDGHISSCIEGFAMRYQDIGLAEISIDANDALRSLESLVHAVAHAGQQIYLFIDEYDNFANEVMISAQTADDRYAALVHEAGPLKTLFKTLKALTSSSVIDRMFLTGVSPIVLSDITSGYNIAADIYLEPEFNDLCGFREEELGKALTEIARQCEYEPEKAQEAIEMARTWYKGYMFTATKGEQVYNPTLSLYFLQQFQKSGSFPRNMLDANLATNESKLTYIAQLPEGRQLLMDLARQEHQVLIPDVSKRFGIQEMLSKASKDQTFLASFLYYFGVLTIGGESEDLHLILQVPNLVVQGMYVDRIRQMLLPEPEERDQGRTAARLVSQQGEMQPLCDFMEQHYFQVFHNRDYRGANELTIKTAFLTLLYNDLIYVMDSEPELERRYADLCMLIRPDRRHGKVFDILIAFEFVPLHQIGLSEEKARTLSPAALRVLPAIKQALQNAAEQVEQYGDILEQKYDKLRLQRFAVVSLGFERLVFKKMEGAQAQIPS
ncbi:MAG: AAA family ATPase [Candidatus Electrothrix sp. GW3-4]|uniref:AAA family ATPase n=1 Tax=Candidatus Electrothrix sp. GW3-4 TaxID=3126740 RepID=UPI0030CDCE2B